MRTPRLALLIIIVPVSLLPGHDFRAGVAIAQTAESVIAGRVLDSTGKPMQGVAVFPQHLVYQNGARQLEQAVLLGPNLIPHTNMVGEFRIAGLRPGRYYLATMDATSVETRSHPVSIPSNYLKGRDWKNASAIDLQPGQEADNIEIRLLEVPTFSLTGKVLAPDGAPASAAIVHAIPEAVANGPRTNDDGVPMGRTRSDGSFEFRNLTSGSYVVEVAAYRGSRVIGSGRSIVSMGNTSVRDTVIRLNPAAKLRGAVRLEDSAQKNLPWKGRTPPNITLTNAIGVTVTDFRNVTIKSDGTFEIDSIMPGTYHWMIWPGLGFYVKAAHAGEVDITRAALTLAPGDASVNILLAQGTATVSVTVLTDNGEPASFGGIALWAANPNSGSSDDGVIWWNNGDGLRGRGQVFVNLAPGRYFAVALPEHNSGGNGRSVWNNPTNSGMGSNRSFLNLLAPEAALVELKEDSQLNLELRPVPVERIREAEKSLAVSER